MQRFKKLRILNRKTQTELGKFLGLSRAEYDAYEKGDTPITPEIESALSKYYNVEATTVYKDDDTVNEASTDPNSDNTTSLSDTYEGTSADTHKDTSATDSDDSSNSGNASDSSKASTSEKSANSKPVDTDFDYRERLVEMVKTLNNENTGIYAGKKLNKYEYKTLLRQMKNIVLLLDDLRNDK